jgi:hypothetical protein
MKTLTMYGYSDDNVVFEGIEGADEFGCFDDDGYRAQFRVKSESESFELVIHVIYWGHWCFGIGPENGDGEDMPNWEVVREWGSECAYSETVRITVPDDAVLTRYGKV